MNISDIIGWILNNIIPFVVLLSILVFVHELGHFLVARLCGVRVEVFSIGFGKKLLSYKKGDTVYCVSMIPLGGYVKMFGEQGGDVVPESERSVSFTHKNVWQRIAIVLAGPLMNLFFAILVFGGISYFGEETRSARIPDVVAGSPAAQSGFQALDSVLAVNGNKVRSYEEFQKELNKAQSKNANIQIKRKNGEEVSLSAMVSSIKNPNIFSTESNIGQIEGLLPFAKGTTIAVIYDSLAYRSGLRTGDEIKMIDGQLVQNWNELNVLFDGKNHEVTLAQDSKLISIQSAQPAQSLSALGIEEPDLYLSQIVPDSPANKADLLKNDKIISINGEAVSSWDQVLNKIKSYDGKEALSLVLLRDGVEVMKKVTPLVTTQMTVQGQEDKRYTIGIMPVVNYANPEVVKVKADSFFAALLKGTQRSYEISAMTAISFVRMFQGQVSHKNVGGLISIGKAAKDSYEMGMQAFFSTMAILSISLFILNLLPVPVLDGGHLVFYIVEVIKGSPLSVKKIEIAHQIGFALLMGLMVLALFNDVTRFLFKS